MNSAFDEDSSFWHAARAYRPESIACDTTDPNRISKKNKNGIPQLDSFPLYTAA